MSTTTLPADASPLPSEAPPAPWRAHACGIVWWTRPDRPARERLRDRLAPALGTEITPLVCVGALLDYDDTPVGSYREVLALVVIRRGADVFTHVPFIAVDSPDSVVGGRVNWALPKTLAEFDGAPRSDVAMRAAGEDWTVRATPRAYGPVLPWVLPPAASLIQAGPDGARVSARPRGHGTARLARVTVQTSAPDVTDLLPSGRFLGMLSHNLTGYLPPATLEHTVNS